MNDGNARQQIVENIKKFSNILVTVNTNPSVDELSAALGLTIMLNKLDKRATAVVSGELPPAITFLDPGKTFEHTVNSLRDFIIALDKEKADHLRYKVDGDVVKIFITPYRSELSQDDLEFSQGDYNVEMVIALGVRGQDHLDTALAAHGRIFHDATVATISTDTEASKLGSIDWRDPAASSLSEMLVSLADALKEEEAILDEQIATAFLTGIVSATDRFSNDHTSSRVMTMAAQLMAAGANQQLIAAKLEEAHEIGPNANASEPVEVPAPVVETLAEPADDPTVLNLSGDSSSRMKIDRSEAPTSALDAAIASADAAGVQPVDEPASSDAYAAPLEAPALQPLGDTEASTATIDEQALSDELDSLNAPVTSNPLDDLQKELAGSVPDAAPQPAVEAPAVEEIDLPAPVMEAPAPAEPTPEFSPQPAPPSVPDGMPDFEPIDLPTPAAPVLEPLEPPVTPEPSVTSAISAHPGSGYISSDAPTEDENRTSPEEGFVRANTGKTIDPFSADLPPLPTVPDTTTSLDQNVFNQLDQQTPSMPAMPAAAPVAPETQYEQPLPDPMAMGLPPLPPLPDFSTLPPEQPSMPPASQPGQFPSGGAISSDQLGDIFGNDSAAPAADTPLPPPPAPPAPGQFRIPGQ